jgi:hypothetical protein
MADDGYKHRDLDDQFQAFLPHLFRWLVLVAAIAVGVALGLYLFFKIVGAEMQNDMQEHIHSWRPTFTTTPNNAP